MGGIMKKILFILFISLLFVSCYGSRNHERAGYFRNGAGEWEYAYNYERWEKTKGERTEQVFSIGDSHYYFQPGSLEAIKWIDERRQRLRESAIRQGRNVDFYIDQNIDEDERW